MRRHNEDRTCARHKTDELGLSVHTIRAWIARRKISSVRLGRAVRIPASEIMRLLDQGTIPAVDDRRRGMMQNREPTTMAVSGLEQDHQQRSRHASGHSAPLSSMGAACAGRADAVVCENVGRALSPEAEQQLLTACAASRSRSLLPAVTLAQRQRELPVSRLATHGSSQAPWNAECLSQSSPRSWAGAPRRACGWPNGTVTSVRRRSARRWLFLTIQPRRPTAIQSARLQCNEHVALPAGPHHFPPTIAISARRGFPVNR